MCNSNPLLYEGVCVGVFMYDPDKGRLLMYALQALAPFYGRSASGNPSWAPAPE